MTRRRSMITPSAFPDAASAATIGLTFVGCELMGATTAQTQAPAPASTPSLAQAQTTGQGAGQAPARSRRREVVVNGKRVKTVDVHAHCSVPEAMALVSAPLPGPPPLLFSKIE